MPWEPCPTPAPPAPKQQDTWAGKGKETEAKRNLTPGWEGSLKSHPPWLTPPSPSNHNLLKRESGQPQPPTFQNPSSDRGSG